MWTILYWIGFITCFIGMVIWPLSDEWFKEFEDEYNQEGWYDEK